MAKEIYVGVGSKARKVKSVYVGVDGKARKVKKGYVGDKDGIPRLFLQPYEQLVNYTMLYDYGNECTAITGGWNYYGYYDSSLAKGQTFSTKTFTKKSNCLYFSGTGTGGRNCEGVILSANAINFSGYTAMFVNSSIVTTGKQIGAGVGFLPSGTTNLGLAVNYTGLDLHYTDSNGSYTTGDPVQTKAISLTSSLRSAIKFGSWGWNGTIAVNIYNITAFKPDNWSELASIAGVSDTSISTLLSNSATILNNSNAVDFMIAQCTGEFMAMAIDNATFLTALASSPYKEKVYANEHWSKFIQMVA